MTKAHPLAVLVVEDERVVAWDLREILNALGHDCYAIASSGQDALRAAEQQRPDLVLMDIRLKGAIDGIETARLLQERHGEAVRIIFLSAHSRADLGERARRVRVAAWMRKPINAAMLRKTLAQVLAED
ncbi:MAG TPA: response regulator [Polyangiales bacterium]|nr:response regulator [Polyangiales bacterium]